MDAQPEVEREIASDLVKRAAMISPVIVIVAALIGGRDAAASAAIGLALVSVNFLIAFLSVLPSVTMHRDGPFAIWTPDIVTLVVLELALGAAAIGLGWYLRSRNTDFV